MPNELIVQIKADSSGLTAGLADATGQVTAAAADMTTATTAATASTKTLAVAQSELKAASSALADAILKVGMAAKQGNAAAQEIIAGYRQEEAAAAEVVATLQEQEAANTAQAAAALEAAAALKKQEAAARGAANANRDLGISGQQAALGGVRVLEGSMMGASRAGAMFLSNTLGLGKVLSAAFPVIGALALGEVLVDVGGELVKFTENAEHLSEVLGVGWLSAAVLELSGFGAEVKKEEDALKKLQDQRDKLVDKQKTQAFAMTEMDEGKAAADTARAAAANAEADRLETFLPRMREQAALAKAISESPYLQQISKDESGIGGAIAAHAPDVTGMGVSGNAAVAALQLQKLNEDIGVSEGKIQILRGEAESLGREAGTAGTPKPTTNPDAEDPLRGEIARARIEAAHAADSELWPQEKIMATLEKEVNLNAADVQAKQTQFALQAEALKATGQASAAELAHLGTMSAETKVLGDMKDKQADLHAAAELSKVADQDILQWFKQGQETLEAQEDAQKRVNKAAAQTAEERHRAEEIAQEDGRHTAEVQIKAAQDEFETTQLDIRAALELGQISERTATERLRAAEELRAQKETGALGQEQLLFDPREGDKELQEWRALQDKMVEAANQSAVKLRQINQQEVNDFQKKWKQAANEFNSDFTRAFNEWATKSQTASQAFGHMFGQMELQLANFVIKWILTKTQMWAKDELLQALGLGKEKAAQTTAATQQIASNNAVLASNAALNTSVTALTSAETAFAGATTAAASASAASVIGHGVQIASNVTMAESDQGLAAAEAALAAAPDGVLAAIAAGAEMYAAFIPWTTAAGFDTGGMLPHMGMAFNQSGSVERVLSPSQTHNFEKLVNTNTSSRKATLNYAPTIYGGVSRETLEAHSADMVQKLRRMLRPEAFA